MSFVIRVSALIMNGDKMLFVKEGKENLHFGKWNLPGGHLELGEEMETAVLREIKEETGLTIKVSGIIGIYTCFNHKHYLHFVFGASSHQGTLQAQEGEILDVAWFGKKDIDSMEEASFIYPEILKKMLKDSQEKELVPLSYMSEFINKL